MSTAVAPTVELGTLFAAIIEPIVMAAVEAYEGWGSDGGYVPLHLAELTDTAVRRLRILHDDQTDPDAANLVSDAIDAIVDVAAPTILATIEVNTGGYQPQHIPKYEAAASALRAAYRARDKYLGR